MTLPDPRPGMVIRYGYLWESEARSGSEEGRKDRLCAIVIAEQDGQVAVVPITHTPPYDLSNSLKLPSEIARRIGLDDGQSWIVISEINAFRWPGSDIRPAQGNDWLFGILPDGILKTLTTRLRARVRDGGVKIVNRHE